jgi:chitosanase
MSSTLFRRSIYLSLLVSGALAKFSNVTRRDASEFQADTSFDIQALYDFVKGGSGDLLATYGTCNGCDTPDTKLHGHSDKMEGLITFMSDADIDCDGVNWECPGNPDGQSQTTFGSADTYQMPWFVLPDEWYRSQGIVANNLGAIICDGKMFYGVFADSNGNTPQVIGEISLVLGNACWPDAGLSGAVGHSDPDVAYIVFAGVAPEGVGEQTLEYGPLKELGDQKVREMLEKIGAGAPPSGGGQESDPEPSPSADPEPSPEPSAEATEVPEPSPEPSPEPEVPEPEPSSPSCSAKKRSNLGRRHRRHRRHSRRSNH